MGTGVETGRRGGPQGGGNRGAGVLDPITSDDISDIGIERGLDAMLLGDAVILGIFSRPKTALVKQSGRDLGFPREGEG